MFDRRLITHFNWPLLVMALVLTVIGIVNLYSATSSFDAKAQTSFFHAQIIWAVVGLLSLFIVMSVHYRHFRSFSYWFYGLSVLLLVLVLVAGKQVSGHQSWLSLGPLSFQPTEFAKLGLIFGLSRQLSTWEKKRVKLKDLFPSFILFLLPTVLVVLQGDLGSSLFFGLIYVSLALIHGVHWRLIVSMMLIIVVSVTIAYFFFLSPYQKSRIITFVNPEMDRKGAGYHLIQSKIAVGSGGLVGKGYLKGQTHKLRFIPERHTDFVFPVLAEEWGFLGSLFVLGAFLVFLFTGIWVAYKANDRFSFFLSIGVCALFFWHFVVNLGGVLGLMPLTGVPLPFFSYGGSALLTAWLGVALLLNVSMRRFMFTPTPSKLRHLRR